MPKSQSAPTSFPAQHQNQQPGVETEMRPIPREVNPLYRGSDKLKDKIAVITGGDSGIGRAVAIYYAMEGANVAICYLDENDDARKTQQQIEERGRGCLTIAGDVGDESFCRHAIQQVVDRFGRIDILVNNAGEQHPQQSIEDVSAEQLERTFRTNIFGYFYMVKAALPHMSEGSAIINTTSVTAYQGSPMLLDYSATKGAIVTFTRSLAIQLAPRKIRVNAVAPGPIWTPLIPATFPADKVEKFGQDTQMKRAGQPDEIAPSYVFLASNIDSSYMSGQVLHPNGGDIVES